MQEFKSPSGVTVKISPAPFEDSLNLKDAVFKEAAKIGFDIDVKAISMNMDMDGLLPQLIKAFVAVDTSAEVREKLLPCLSRCLYNGEKITLSSFEEPERRKDYYPVIVACMKENILPLSESLISLSSMLFGKAETGKTHA